jgi:hypothetical protein
MPFSEFIHSYAPDQLAQLTEAFDLTWPELLLAYGQKPLLNWRGCDGRSPATFLVAPNAASSIRSQ